MEVEVEGNTLGPTQDDGRDQTFTSRLANVRVE